MKRVIHFVLRLDCYIAPIIVLLLFIDVLLQVASRLTPGAALSWTVEMGSVLLGALIWMGLSVGIREEAHVRFTILSGRSSEKVQLGIRFVNNLLFIAYLLLLAVFIVQMMTTYLNLGRMSVMLGINMAWVRMPMIIGCCFSALLLLFKQVQILLGKEKRP